VELRAVKVLGLDVVDEVGDGFGGCFGIELDTDFAGTGIEIDLRVCGGGR
jgi:hypothetical protein